MLTDRPEVIISSIRKKLKSTYWLTPTNFITEKEKFLSSRRYNPMFLYPNAPKKLLHQKLVELSNISYLGNDKAVEKILRDKIEETKLRIMVVLNRGTPAISTLSQRLYKLSFGERYLKLAKADSLLPGKFGAKNNPSNILLRRKVTSYLYSYGLKDWEIEFIDKQDFNFRVRHKDKNILISKHVNMDFTDLDGILAHEIDGHVIRAVNSKQQLAWYLKKPLPFYIKTEEGLASFLGDYLSTSSFISRKEHAIKYLSGYVALNNSFREVYNFLMDHGFTKDLAFMRTMRVKRGFTDTSIYGSFAREAIYYEGLIDVKDYIDSGGDIKKLYAAKAGLDDLHVVEIPENLIVPERITEYVKVMNS